MSKAGSKKMNQISQILNFVTNFTSCDFSGRNSDLR